MQKSFAVILIVVLLGTTNSLLALDQSGKIKELEQRISKLEKSLQPIFAQQKAKENITKLQAQARKKMRNDSKIYSRKQLQEIEALYQSRGHKWGSAQKIKNLKLVISKYPKANRAGCAMLYLGQTSKGQARENYLKQAIEKHSDCFYGDGMQVGPYAKFNLALTYLKSEKKPQAAALFNEIKTKFPDAIDHRGRNLVSMIKNIKI